MLVATAIGCGSENAATGAGLTDKELAASLLGPHSLPRGARVVSGLPVALCAPIPILTGNGGQTAESKMFAFDQVRVQEAVGSFEGEGNAENAFRELTSEERRECIAGAISSFGAGRGDYVKNLPVEEISSGDEGSLLRYLVVHPGSGPISGLELVVVRTGSRVATLAFIVNTGHSLSGVVHHLSRIATRALAGAEA